MNIFNNYEYLNLDETPFETKIINIFTSDKYVILDAPEYKIQNYEIKKQDKIIIRIDNVKFYDYLDTPSKPLGKFFGYATLKAIRLSRKCGETKWNIKYQIIKIIKIDSNDDSWITPNENKYTFNGYDIINLHNTTNIKSEIVSGYHEDKCMVIDSGCDTIFEQFQQQNYDNYIIKNTPSIYISGDYKTYANTAYERSFEGFVTLKPVRLTKKEGRHRLVTKIYSNKFIFRIITQKILIPYFIIVIHYKNICIFFRYSIVENLLISIVDI